MNAARAMAVTLAFAIGCGRSGLPAKNGRVGDGGPSPTSDSAASDASRAEDLAPANDSGPRKATAVFAGEDRACAVVDDHVYCWNIPGCRQGGTIHNSSSPVQVQGLPSGIKAVTFGDRHTCALADDGVLCWGSNDWDQLGNGSEVGSPSPVRVQGLGAGVTAMAAGTFHTCAIVHGGLWCWGWRQYDEMNDTAPGPVSGLASGVEAVTAGMWFTCAVVNRREYCFGDNGSGHSDAPIPVSGLDMDVSALDGTCALGAEGIKCWNGVGANSNGTWGSGSATVQGDMSSATAIAGDCALIAGGIQCWQWAWIDGANGSRVRVSTEPEPVQGLASPVVSLAAGGSHMCVVVQDKVQCWCSSPQAQPEILTIQFP